MEKKKKSYLSKAVFGLLIVAFTVCCIIAAPITEAKGTLWSLFPPVIAIGLALITKEVYSSLFVGILSGGIIYAAASGTGFEGTFKAVVQDGLITNLSNAYNVGYRPHYRAYSQTVKIIVNEYQHTEEKR